MRLFFWGLLFFLMLFGSVTGVATAFTDAPLAEVLSFLFLVGAVALGVAGLVRLALAIRLGRREGYGQPTVTLRGEVVRSRAEAIIADWFTRHRIAYQYEPPLVDGFLRRAGFRADFLLPQFDAYVEYWGLVYAERSYVQRMNYKMDYYRRHGLRLISIYPNDMSDLDSTIIHQLPL